MTTEPTATTDESPVRFLVASALVYLALAALVAILAGRYRFALAVLAGGGVSLLNLLWLKRHLGQLLLRSGGRGSALLAQFNLITRLTVTALLLYLLIVPAKLNIAGLFTGLSALFVAVLAYTVAIITRRGKDQ
jgi:peptidoglycan biosynthesis protein MviN/MurJ (putative lipid II flippase)